MFIVAYKVILVNIKKICPNKILSFLDNKF